MNLPVDEQPGSFTEVLQFWRDGGLRLVQPLSRPEGRASILTILLQPDGDVVLGIPSDFGTADTDQAASRELLERASATIQRVARDGFGDVSRSASRLIDYSLGTGSLAVFGTMAAAEAALWVWSIGVGVTACWAGGRWIGRRAIRPWLGRRITRYVRAKIR